MGREKEIYMHEIYSLVKCLFCDDECEPCVDWIESDKGFHM